MNPTEQALYKPHLLLEGVGSKGQAKLKNAKVLCIGAGGLGCPLLMYLAGAGVGTIGIVDHDVIEISNLQRQILFTQEDLNQNKAITAKKRLALLNPFIDLIAYPEKFSPELLKKYDIIADCTDNFETRYGINQACVEKNKILVTASVSKFQGQCLVINPKQGPCYQCGFPQDASEGFSCGESGILGVVPGILGCIQAAEVLKIILNLGTPLTGKLLQLNVLNFETTIFNLEADPQCSVCAH